MAKITKGYMLVESSGNIKNYYCKLGKAKEDADVNDKIFEITGVWATVSQVKVEKQPFANYFGDGE